MTWKAGSGFVTTWQVGSGSEIASFASATLPDTYGTFIFFYYTQAMEGKTKLEYAGMLERLEDFNTKLSADFDRLEQIKKVLDATATKKKDNRK